MTLLEPKAKKPITREELRLAGSRLFLAHGLAKLGRDYLRKVAPNDLVLALISSIDHEVREAMHVISKAL